MAHNARKTRKLRGSRTCGYGNAQKHRGAGSRGGRGMAGSKKQKWSYITKNMPNNLGYSGFKRPQCVQEDINTINVGFIETHLDQLVEEKKASLKDKKYTIDLGALGYDKLLGSGKLSNKLIIKVDSCSATAQKKVDAAGGKIELPE